MRSARRTSPSQRPAPPAITRIGTLAFMHFFGASWQPFRTDVGRTRRPGRKVPAQKAVQAQSGRISRAVVTSAVQLLSMSEAQVLWPCEFPSPVANGRRRTGASHLLSFRRAEWRVVRRCDVTLTPAAILAQLRPRLAAVSRAPPLRRHLLGHSIAQPTRGVCMWVDHRTRDAPRPEEYSRDRQNRYRRTGHTPECGCRRSRAHLVTKIVERACADAEHQTRGGAL